MAASRIWGRLKSLTTAKALWKRASQQSHYETEAPVPLTARCSAGLVLQWSLDLPLGSCCPPPPPTRLNTMQYHTHSLLANRWLLTFFPALRTSRDVFGSLLQFDCLMSDKCLLKFRPFVPSREGRTYPNEHLSLAVRYSFTLL